MMNSFDENEGRVLWNRTTTRELIIAYKKHLCLYDVRNIDYKNKEKRFEALKAIKMELLARGKRIRIEDIKKKIHGLRTQYTHQLQKIKRSKEKANGPNELYEPRLWCFAHLHFLRNSKEHDSSSVYSSDDVEVVPESKDETNSTHYVDMERDISDTESFNIYDGNAVKHEVVSINDLPETPDYNKTENDDLSTFAKLVELEMRKINNAQALRTVKKVILNALMDAQEACQS